MHDINIDTTAASRTEGEPISNRRARRDQFKRTIAILAELFPHCFAVDKWAPHRPLKIGIHVDLVATGLVAPRECTIALTAYTGRLQYQRAVAAGGARVDLDGNAVGEVAADEIEHARVVVAQMEAQAVAKAEASQASHQPHHKAAKPATCGTITIRRHRAAPTRACRPQARGRRAAEWRCAVSDDYMKRIRRFLDRHGIDDYRFVHRRKHRAVVVEHGGKVTTIVFPLSGSDWRGPANAVTSLRRALGLVGEAP